MKRKMEQRKILKRSIEQKKKSRSQKKNAKVAGSVEKRSGKNCQKGVRGGKVKGAFIIYD